MSYITNLPEFVCSVLPGAFLSQCSEPLAWAICTSDRVLNILLNAITGALNVALTVFTLSSIVIVPVTSFCLFFGAFVFIFWSSCSKTESLKSKLKIETASPITIAVDFDDVLVPCMFAFVKHCKDEGLAEGSLENLEEPSFETVFKNHDKDRSICHQDLFESFVSSEIWTKLHLDPPEAQCIEKLRGLKEIGFRLIVVSAREKRFETITRSFLDLHFKDLFDKIYLCNYYGIVDESNPRITKSYACKKENCALLIDDNYKYVKEVHENLGIKTILFGSWSWSNYWSLSMDHGKGIYVSDWSSLDLNQVKILATNRS